MNVDKASSLTDASSEGRAPIIGGQTFAAIKFISLFLYSFAPAGAKLLENQNIFILGYLFAVVFIFFSAKGKFNLYLSPIRIFGVIFICYGLFLSGVLSLKDLVSEESIYVGIAMFLIPLGLSLLSGPATLESLLYLLPWVGFLHGVVAIALYPLLPISSWLGDLILPLQDGVMAFRLSSVSGSLAFSSLMAVSYVIALLGSSTKGKRGYIFSLMAAFFLACTFLSLQRSMWIAVTLFTLYAFFHGYLPWILVLKATLIMGIALLILNLNMGYLFDVFLELIKEKIFSINNSLDDSAIGERLNQWFGLINNIYEFPLGSGIGQIGQASRDHIFMNSLIGIPDGDFFRIISEYGPVGFCLVAIIIARLIDSIHMLFKRTTLRGNAALYSVFCVLVIQAIGSNMTELYFINFIFFVLLLNPRCNEAR